MKKKYLRIILILIGVVLIIGGISGYQIYQMVMGSEELSGNQESIPEQAKIFTPITTDSADWSNWRGPNFDGKSKTTGIIKDWSKGLEKIWEVNFLCQDNSTASWSAPVIQGNRLIIPGRDENNDLVFCLDPENGKLIWKGSYPAGAETSHGPGARATAFIDSSRVYTFGRSGDLVCWNLENGKLLWKKNVKDLGGIEPQWGYSTSPLVYENMVIVQGGGKALIVAYDKHNGNLLWKSMSGEAGYAFAIPIKIENENKLLVYHGTGLSCIEPTNGKELWRSPWATEYNVNATTPIVDSNIIFHSSGYGMGCEAIKFTKNSFTVLYKNNVMEAQHTDPVLIDGYIYGYSGESSQNKGSLKCIELATGKEMWTSDLAGNGTLTFVDGHLICLDLKGNLYLVKPDPKKFILVGEIKKALENVDHFAWTVPVVANGKLYLRYLQHLICYKLTK